MTVSLTHATQGSTVVTTKPSTAPTCYTTTRSAAMMALTLGQRPRSPAAATRKVNGDSKLFSSSTASNATTTPTKAHSPASKAINCAPLKQSTQINGSHSGGSASSGSDNDGFNTSSSSSATALRRLYFKSGRKSKMNSTATTSMTSIPLSAVSTAATAYHTSVGGLPHSHTAAVPKVVIMGSSTASMTDANINTSTDSASTLVTSVTHTDTSETCDSLDLGDNSGQSEPLFSSLEEPLLTAIQIDSEHDGNEMELTSCSMYSRPDMSLQDSTESQESSLSILATEPSSTTPLLASHRRHSNVPLTTALEKGRQPKTAPAPTSSAKHFTFDPPKSPKSARTSEKSRSRFSFKDKESQQQQAAGPRPSREDWEQRLRTTGNYEESNLRRDSSPGRSGKYRAYNNQRNSCYYDPDDDDEMADIGRSKKLRSRESNSSSKSRNRYSTASPGMPSNKTSPKREPRRSPTNSKLNSAPPTMKDANFFAGSTALPKSKQLSPSSQQANTTQRKYSSSSSSGGSERDRERGRNRERECAGKDITMFPFDREAIDYERIQRECFAVDENSSSATATSDSEEGEACSVYERRLSSHHGSPKSADVFQQYSLLTQQEQQQGHAPSRQNSKRIRSDSVIHTTIRENQQYVPQSDAFYPQSKTSTSPGEQSYNQHSPKSYAELNKFDEIASKFDKIPPKHGGSNVNLSINSNGHSNGASSNATASSPTGSMRGTTPSPLPDLRVDFFSEQQMHPRTKSFKSKTSPAGAAGDNAPSGMTGATHDHLDECQTRNGSSSAPASAGAVGGNNAGGPINVTSNPMEAAVCTLPRATIVVQQPSLSLDNTVETLLIKNEGDFISVEQGKDSASGGATTALGTVARKRSSTQLQHPPHHPLGQSHHLHQHSNNHTHSHGHTSAYTHQQQKRDDNMRQLLDVTNTLTFEELRDFEMRYGSPHHSRSQSVKTPGSRASGRPNQLCLPQQRSRVASMPNTGVEEEYYRLRHFSITGKGVINRGDSLKSRRSRSNNSVASSNSSTEHLTAAQLPAPSSARTSATCSLASSRESSTSNPGSGPYRVLMLGGSAVGKSSLVSQFMTSEYLHAYDTSIDDDSGEKAVSVLLSGEESEIIFIDHPYTEMKPDDCLTNYDPHGYCVIYSSADRSSFTVAEHVLQVLWTNQNIAQKAVILVANKADLARSRLVTSEEGKAMATAYDCKFIETSVGINHNVDELLVGLLSQIRLKLENPEKSRDLFRKRSIRKSKRRACSPLSGACLTGGTNPNTPLGPINNIILDANTPPGSAQSSPRKYRGSRTSTSLKVKGLLGRVWARDSKSKSCENLHVL